MRSSADADRGFSGWMGSSLSRDRWNESVWLEKARGRESAPRMRREGGVVGVTYNAGGLTMMFSMKCFERLA